MLGKAKAASTRVRTHLRMLMMGRSANGTPTARGGSVKISA
jgi:hypothetical protein